MALSLHSWHSVRLMAHGQWGPARPRCIGIWGSVETRKGLFVGHFCGKFMQMIGLKAPGNYSASIWFNNFSTCSTENFRHCSFGEFTEIWFNNFCLFLRKFRLMAHGRLQPCGKKERRARTQEGDRALLLGAVDLWRPHNQYFLFVSTPQY